MADDYFSDRELGPRPRVEQEIKPSAWGGIVALVESLTETGAFGVDFPAQCPDGAGPCGTDNRAFGLAVQGEIPDLEWPLRTETRDDGAFGPTSRHPFAPPTPVILDLVEFCHAHVAQPVQGSFHSFFGHHHLTFGREAGQDAYRSRLNRLLARNGVAYELHADGRVERIGPPILRETLRSTVFQTGDPTLDDLLEKARSKFVSRDFDTRREALEKLWDAWERLKTVEDPSDKKLSVAALLDKACPEPTLRAILETDAKELTNVGNRLQIRHMEVGKVPVSDSAHIDYLFHRLFSLIFLALRKR